MRDDDFEPNLGKIHSHGGKHGRKYLHRVMRATALAGSRSQDGLSPRRGTFDRKPDRTGCWHRPCVGITRPFCRLP